MNIAVIITAAGRSERFGGRDKLSEDLGGRALLMRTVELFNKRPEVGCVIVAGPPDHLDDFRFRFGDQLGFHGAKIVPGGRVERWETVKNALTEVPDQCTHVAVHDAARPGTPVEVIDRVFEAAKMFKAVIPAVHVTATIKRVSKEAKQAAEADPIAAAILGDAARPKNTARRVEETIDRQRLVEVQTPQIFERGLLLRAYAQKDLSGATDDASLVERLGEEVYVVNGDPRNLKVTTPADLHLMRAVLGVRPPAERPTHKQF